MIEAENRAEGATPPACRYDTPGAAKYLLDAHGIPIAPATLSKKRSVGGGPCFVKFGRAALYSRSALDTWALAQLGPERRSTSET